MYQRGRAAEYKVRDALKEMGYIYSIRSAGSHSPVDLLVSNLHTILAVQVKSGAAEMSIKEEKALGVYAIAYKAYPIVAQVKNGKAQYRFARGSGMDKHALMALLSGRRLSVSK